MGAVSKRLDFQSSSTSSGKGSSSAGSNTSPSSSKHVKGKKFRGFLASLSTAGGRHSVVALAYMVFLLITRLHGEGFHSGYIVPFDHLPPVSWEPFEFPSHAVGFAKVHVLQGEVGKMLQKGALKLVDHLGLRYYSQLFLAQMALRVVASSDRLESEQIHHPHHIQDGDSIFGVRVFSGKGTLCFSSTSRMPTSRHPFIWTLDLISKLHLEAKSVSLRSMFWPFCNSSGLHWSVYSSFWLGSQEGDKIPWYLDNLLVIVHSFLCYFNIESNSSSYVRT